MATLLIISAVPSCADLGLKGGAYSNGPDQTSTPSTVGGPVNLPASGSETEVTAQLIDMNDDGTVDGIDLDGDGVAELKFIATDNEDLAGLDLDGDGTVDYYLSFASDPVQILDNGFLYSDFTLTVDEDGTITGIDFNGDGFPEDTGLGKIHNDGNSPFLSANGVPGVYTEAVDVDFFCIDDYACHNISYTIDGPDGSQESVLLNITDGLSLGGGSPGVYTLNYRAVDYAGNEGPLYTLAITILGGGFSVSAGGSQTGEDGSTVEIEVSLDFTPTSPVTIPVQVTRPGEATPSTTSLVLDESNLTGQVTITGKDDDVDDGNKNYKVHFGPTSSADEIMNGLARQSVQLKNIDDDTAGVMTMPAGDLVTSEAGAQDTFTVYLSSKPAGAVVIDISTLSGNNEQVTISPVQLSFNAGNWDSPQTVTVTGQDDGGLDSTSDTDTVVLAVNTAGTQDAVYDALIGLPQLNVTNMDDDNAGVIVNAVDDNNINTGDSHMVNVSLTSPPVSGTVTISFSNPDATTLTLSDASFDFTSADYDTVQTLTITAVDSDNIAEGTLNLTVGTSISAPGDAAYDVLSVPNIGVNVTDEDAAGLLLDGETALMTGENGDFDTFTVALTSEPASGSVDVIITTNSSGEGNFAGNPSVTLTFTTGNWDAPQTVTINGVDDTASPERDGTADYTLTLNPGGSAEYNSLVDVTVDVTNLDDDRFIFTSTSNTNGNFGGISGADSICNTDPNRPDKSVTYKALLTGDGGTRKATENAYAGDGQLDWVLEVDTNYMRGTEEDVLILQSDANRLFDFSVTSDIENPVSDTAGNVWTGFHEDWTSTGEHCQNWNNGGNGKDGNFGLRNQTDKTMLDSNFESCKTLNYLYCIEQP